MYACYIGNETDVTCVLFTATDADGPPARGTKIVLSLKEGAEEVSLFLSLYVWASRLTACFIHSSRRVKN